MKQKERSQYIRGRGAQINTHNPFDKLETISEEGKRIEEDEMDRLKETQHIPVHPKSIVNKVTSLDVGMEYSLNPYQGCEHGCIYCYARNSHTYWGYSAGIEFEQKILVKENAPDLLKKKITSRSWKPIPIMLSGNTDCYQPAEKKYQLTRQMLEILWQHRHPVGIITKNQLIVRDIDILEKMARVNLVKVSISITTLDEKVRLKMEPRTATGLRRIETVRKLSDAGIPVNIMMAPIIPSMNDKEIFDIAKMASRAGARSFNYTMVRLNGAIGELFDDWIHKSFPQKAQRVLNQIASCHGGALNDSQFGRRMKGDGNIAEVIKQQVKMAREKYYKGRKMPDYNTLSFQKQRTDQLKLF
jgi:DNA repair photolyase